MAAVTTAAPAHIVELANKLAKLGYWAEWDTESAYAAARERYPGATELNAEQLKEVFLQLGYDKVKEEPEEEEEAEQKEEGEEGDEAAEPVAKPPRPPPEVSKFAEATFDLLNASGAATLTMFHIFSTINICKNGFGESAFRFALKCQDDEASTGALLEAQLWKAITIAANGALDAISRNHLRRAWRAADKAEAADAAAEGEEMEESKGELDDGADKPPADPASVRVVVDSFVEKVTEDERLASILLKEVPVPIEEPKPEEQENLPPAEDD